MKYERRVIERNSMKKIQQKKELLKKKNNVMLQGQNYNKEVFKKVFNKGPSSNKIDKTIFETFIKSEMVREYSSLAEENSTEEP